MAGGGSKPGERRGGRKTGTPNKLTASIKAAIEASFDQVGGAKYLARMAMEQPAAYMTLLGKVLPTQTDLTVKTTPAFTVHDFVIPADPQ